MSPRHNQRVSPEPLVVSNPPERKHRSDFSHYLPRLKREFYQADAVIFWTMPISNRWRGWLTDHFHATFREMMLHAAVREGLVCPAYCLMPDHIHLVWMGLRRDTDQRNGIKFLRAQIVHFSNPPGSSIKRTTMCLRPRNGSGTLSVLPVRIMSFSIR